MAVLLTPPFLHFFDANGDVLAGGKIYTYTATGGTFSTPKATFTTEAGDVEHPNPVILDAAGRPATGNGSVWLEGTYDILVTDANDVEVESTLNVTAFTTTAAASSAYFESFSGTGSQTAFTTSEDLGTDEKAIYVWVDQGLRENTTNGDFATDSDWTKGTGWTIGSGVATATRAISTAIEQTSAVTILEGQAYSVTYTITRTAGGLIPSVGGSNGTERTASGTYTEIIVAGSTQTLAFTGNGFTGTLDNVSITPAVSAGFNYQSPANYTIDGTTLTFSTAPAVGSNNILVSSPSTLVNAASAAAADAAASAAAALASENAAATSETNAATSETNAATSASNASTSETNAATSETNAAASAATAVSAVAAAVNEWTFDTSTTMADPGTGDVRFNNATPSSVTQIAISAQTAESGNPDLSDFIVTWDDSTASNKGTITMRQGDDTTDFVIFTVNGTITDNTTWLQIPVTYVTGAGTFDASDEIFTGFARTGDAVGGTVTNVASGDGLTGGPITTTGTLSVDVNGLTDTVITASDEILFGDVSDSNNIKKDTVQGILDLASGGVWNLLSEAAVTTGSTVTVDTNIDSTYDQYVISLEDISFPFANKKIELEIGASWQTSGYSGTRNHVYGGADHLASAGTTALDWDTIAFDEGTIRVFINSPSESKTNHSVSIIGWGRTGTASDEVFAATNWNGTAGALTGVRFTSASGNMSGGRVKLYGIT